MGDIVTYTLNIRVQFQCGLDEVGIGASALVYKLDEDVVLKARRVYERLSTDASSRERGDYVSESIFLFSLLEDERTVCKLLEQRQHSNIVQMVDTGYPEGIYLRRYKNSDIPMPTQSGRILWYQDIIRALLHIHKLGISHSDLRMDNILFDTEGHVFLCDFSSCSPFGQMNPAAPHPALPVQLNGLAETVSEATDMFAMGSLMFRIETGNKPELTADNGVLAVPQVHTGHGGVDSMIRKAWLGQYSSTEQMLADAESLQDNIAHDQRGPVQLASTEELRERVRRWRNSREDNHGCVLYSFVSGEQLRQFADEYNYNMDEELRFRDYRVPS